MLKKLPTEAGLFSNHRIESSPLKIAKHADYIIIVAEASLHYFFHAKVTKKSIEPKHFKLQSMLLNHITLRFVKLLINTPNKVW